jgi:hypothetical protein
MTRPRCKTCERAAKELIRGARRAMIDRGEPAAHARRICVECGHVVMVSLFEPLPEEPA